MAIITSIIALPASPYNDSDLVGIVITNGVPSYFQIKGVNLSTISRVDWFPREPLSVSFEIRQPVLIDETSATFMIQVNDNYLNVNDRGGKLSFRLNDGTSIAYPVITYGPVSSGRLWRAHDEGLITG